MMSMYHNVFEIFCTKRAFQVYLTEIKVVNETSGVVVCVCVCVSGVYVWEERARECSGFRVTLLGVGRKMLINITLSRPLLETFLSTK